MPPVIFFSELEEGAENRGESYNTKIHVRTNMSNSSDVHGAPSLCDQKVTGKMITKEAK